MPRRALLVGINEYEQLPSLRGGVSDMLALEQMLAYHENHAPNYACKHLLSDERRVSRAVLLEALTELFATPDDVLFAFAGHGYDMPGGV